MMQDIAIKEKLTSILSKNGYQSRIHDSGLQLPETSVDSALRPETRLGPNTIEFFGDAPLLNVKTGLFQAPIPSQVYYDPNTQDAWYRIVMMPIAHLAGHTPAIDMWQRTPINKLIEEIENAQSNPPRPVAAVRKWFSKFLPK